MRCTSSIAMSRSHVGIMAAILMRSMPAEPLERPVVVDAAGLTTDVGILDVPDVETDGRVDDLGVDEVGAHHLEPDVGRRRRDPLLLLGSRFLGGHVRPSRPGCRRRRGSSRRPAPPGCGAARGRGGRGPSARTRGRAARRRARRPRSSPTSLLPCLAPAIAAVLGIQYCILAQVWRPSRIAARAAPRKWPLVPLPRDREVEHLSGEHERGGHAEQRHAAVVEFHLGAAQGVAHGGDGRHRDDERDLVGQESVRNVHERGLPGCGRRSTPGRCRRSGSARTVPDPQLLLDQRSHTVQPGRLDGREHAAHLAGDELAVAAGRERVAAGAVPEVEVADEADRLERLEVAVDRGEIRRRQPALEAGGDLLGGQRPVGREQRLEHEPAGGRDAQAAGPEQLDGRVDGLCRRGGV